MNNVVVSRLIGFVILLCAVSVAGYLWYQCGYNECLFVKPADVRPIEGYEECVAMGGIILETYPAQCKSGDATFIQPIPSFGNDEIHIVHPMPNSIVHSPMTIEGEARGSRFMNGQFSIRLIDGEGKGLAFTSEHAQGELAENEFAPFEATLAFFPHTPSGVLLFEKHNSSGLPEFEDTVAIPVQFSSYAAITPTPLPIFTPIPTPTPLVAQQGTLSGSMTIGPICPVEPCKPSVKMFASRTISIYKPDRVTLVTAMTPGPTGQFSTVLPVGDYVVTMLPQILGSIEGVPAQVSIKADAITTLTIKVNTGIQTAEDEITNSDGFSH